MARKSDFSRISYSMKQYKQKRAVYPFPWDYFNLKNSSTSVAKQWKLNKKVVLPDLDNLPKDPDLSIPYLYSITENRWEFQIAWTLENSDNPIALLKWDYKTVAKNILPTIVLAINPSPGTDIDITNSTNKKKFIFDKLSHNLAYDFEDSLEPTSDDTDLATLISEAETSGDFWQNVDYRTCSEIKEAAKSIWNWEYQYLNSNWILTNTWCTF
jgi:hypothetical protein